MVLEERAANLILPTPSAPLICNLSSSPFYGGFKVNFYKPFTLRSPETFVGINSSPRLRELLCCLDRGDGVQVDLEIAGSGSHAKVKTVYSGAYSGSLAGVNTSDCATRRQFFRVGL